MQEIVDFGKRGAWGEHGNGISEEEAIFHFKCLPQGDFHCFIFFGL